MPKLSISQTGHGTQAGWIRPEKVFFRIMWRIIFFSVVSFLVLVAGCLDFGENIETEQPTPEQLAFCQSAMYLNDQLAFEPIGLRIDETGIDATVWFRFFTEEVAVERIFDSNLVSPDSLRNTVSFYSYESMPKWWDADEKVLEGGTLSLSGGIHMTVGIHREERGSTVYIFWCES